MSNATQITLNNGIPNGPAGSATVSTLDALMADGGQATIGSQADVAWSGSGNGSLVAVQKYLGAKLEAVRALLAGTITTSATQAGSWVLSAGSALIGSVNLAVGGSALTATGSSLNVNITGGGSGGGAVTIADGASVTQGSLADAVWSGSGAGSVVSVLKYVGTKVEAVRALLAGTLTVNTHGVTAADGALATIGSEADAAYSGSGSGTLIAIQKYLGSTLAAINTKLAGTLTVATHAVTQSGSWVLSAGSAVIGSVNLAVGGVALTATSNALDVNVKSGVNANGRAADTASAPVALSNEDIAVLLAIAAQPSTGTQSIVAGSASSVTVLASNANRMGATVYNDSTAILYALLKTGGTASTTVYTVQIAAGGYYEVPFKFTGGIIGIWASATGNARVTEFTS